mmetsp:Transcript_47364/g.84726  ORF Transcript_47364/g.84726 Transcript_47364/m.84726 type:complete len:565 (-) Transcript_47364:350-2044(-)
MALQGVLTPEEEDGEWPLSDMVAAAAFRDEQTGIHQPEGLDLLLREFAHLDIWDTSMIPLLSKCQERLECFKDRLDGRDPDTSQFPGADSIIELLNAFELRSQRAKFARTQAAKLQTPFSEQLSQMEVLAKGLEGALRAIVAGEAGMSRFTALSVNTNITTEEFVPSLPAPASTDIWWRCSEVDELAEKYIRLSLVRIKGLRALLSAWLPMCTSPDLRRLAKRVEEQKDSLIDLRRTHLKRQASNQVALRNWESLAIRDRHRSAAEQLEDVEGINLKVSAVDEVHVPQNLNCMPLHLRRQYLREQELPQRQMGDADTDTQEDDGQGLQGLMMAVQGCRERADYAALMYDVLEDISVAILAYHSDVLAEGQSQVLEILQELLQVGYTADHILQQQQACKRVQLTAMDQQMALDHEWETYTHQPQPDQQPLLNRKLQILKDQQDLHKVANTLQTELVVLFQSLSVAEMADKGRSVLEDLRPRAPEYIACLTDAMDIATTKGDVEERHSFSELAKSIRAPPPRPGSPTRLLSADRSQVSAIGGAFMSEHTMVLRQGAPKVRKWLCFK